MQRDPKTGRFLPGNQIAAGNRGNRNPKWGNKNAMTHGLYGDFHLAKVIDDGHLVIISRRGVLAKLPPDVFIQGEDGLIRIRNDVAEMLEKKGMRLE